MIFGDDIGQANLSVYSNGLMGYRTPNIDRIAREGVLFTDYYAEQSCTRRGPRSCSGKQGKKAFLIEPDREQTPIAGRSSSEHCASAIVPLCRRDFVLDGILQRMLLGRVRPLAAVVVGALPCLPSLSSWGRDCRTGSGRTATTPVRSRIRHDSAIRALGSATTTPQLSGVRPAAVSEQVVRHFVRGKESPRGVVWFGARSFWGHLRHLVAAAIATESVDSRDWMTPDEPAALCARIVEVLGGDPAGASLTEGLGRDVYVDFVADTGDDVAVSRAVARLVFAPYELPDPDRPGQFLSAPRGDILFFGGDTAYPVATAQEIMNRVIVPWNQVLEELPEDCERRRQRVLLGIPGNHDWYDGLDGFARMFRRRPPGVEPRARRGRRVAADAAAVRGLGARVRARRHRRQTRGAGAVGLHAGAERELLRFPARPAHRPRRGRSTAHGDRSPAARIPAPRRTGPRAIRRRSSCCPIRSTCSATRARRGRRWSRTCTSTRRRARPSC